MILKFKIILGSKYNLFFAIMGLLTVRDLTGEGALDTFDQCY